MRLDQETLRYIFGFKLRALRQERDLSLKDLAKMSGLSPSYINEIEKGKKYPKSEKIMTLAHSLSVPYDDLISVKLKTELKAVSQVLEKNLLHGLPFDVFGIPAQILFELMAERPLKFSALIGTLLEIARIHNITVEDFFAATLRAQIDMQGHYFADIEEKVNQLKAEMKVRKSGDNLQQFLTVDSIKKCLGEKFKCEVTEEDFSTLEKDLGNTHFFLVKGVSQKFYINTHLSPREKVFILAKEIGHQYMKLKERMTSSHPFKTDSYEVLFNNFKASYFAGALLLPKDRFIEETKKFFLKTRWDAVAFTDWVKSYPGSYSSFFYRLTQILPHFFEIDEMFFLRFGYDSKTDKPFLLTELHLAELHAPHKVRADEHYCRRWITTGLLKKLAATKQEPLVGIQRSSFWGTNEEYLCFSLAFGHELSETDKESVTVGLRITDKVRSAVKFIEDPQIRRRAVCDACEMCGIEDCKERAAPPLILHERQRNDRLLEALERVRAARRSQ